MHEGRVVQNSELFTSKVEAVAEDLRDRIRRSVYTERLPVVAALAEEYGVALNTANRAIAALVSEGILESTPGRGTFVRPGAVDILASQAPPQVGDKLVAFFMPSDAHVYSELYTPMFHVLSENDKYPVLVEEMSEAALDDVLRMKPAAIVVDRERDHFPFAMLKERAHEAGRIVFLQRMESELSFDADYVLSDRTHGAYIATRHLLELGHRRILLLSHLPDDFKDASVYRHSAHYAFAQGYRLALQEADLLEAEVYHLEPQDKTESRKQLMAILSEKTRPTAILSNMDARIISNLDCIRKVGLKVPDDLALVGYFNTPHARGEFPLTSVSIQESEMAAIAAKKIIEGGPHERIMVKPKLIVRESSGSKKT